MSASANTRLQVRPLSREEVRSLDVRAARELSLPTLVLMENAGRGAAEILRQHAGADARVLIVCGPGNNGGDGGVVARHLDAWGYAVRVLWLAEQSALRGDAAAQWEIVEKSGIPQIAASDPADRFDTLLQDADWLVDGLFGTGLSRPIEGPARRVIEALNGSGKPILALDLPSGLDCDTGEPLGGLAVRARVTVSFVAPKLGFSMPGAAVFTGTVEVAEIGLPRCLLAPFLVDSEKSPIGPPGS